MFFFLMITKGKLVLNDGSSFEGKVFGAPLSTSGEVVFNTGMVGYPETLTDPSYYGQILVCTYPSIGNYGVPSNEQEDNLMKHFESEKIQIRGLVIADYSYSCNHRDSIKSLQKWLKEQNIPALTGIDTRKLTQKLRESGVMDGKIIVDKDIPFENHNLKNLVAEVSATRKITYSRGALKIILVDCGVKHSIIHCLLRRGVTVVRVPWDYDFTKEQYDGLLISNGPGDPKICAKTIEHLSRAMLRDKPIFGICLGSQLLALAAGADTYKLKYGHRGQNQPCMENEGKRCYITSQNHGYAVDTASLPELWTAWFSNANDNTNEGIKHKFKPFYAVQFHPEANPGPLDTEYLFDKFIEDVKKWAK